MVFTINNVYVMSVVNIKPQLTMKTETIVIGIVLRRRVIKMMEESIWGYVIMIGIVLIGLIYQEIKGIR